ncbi:NAD(P)-dependent oxidoreductase [Anaerobacillus alkaliphilus]|uniref:NAD(P)-dependent oxidoreductase n=1 Tax=Anaerobacillus alkaliphilus TaxID=1548597 RepID=A0A4V1LG23_9BACI|nr:NAD(P)-dependent oxidoreductase [Anaerobacillus alkaliphilus]RXI98264.1 NAD(P)-dependent oxidoreductase [Anaerobacillus alkaliphilus]
MKKVVVTGALGFIGFSLCQRLVEKGIEVIGIDGMVDERLKDLYEEKLLWIGRNSLFQLINKRIEDIDLEEIMKEVDVVYHLAAATSRDRNWGLLRTTIEDNVGVTGKIINACGSNVKLIFTSSTQVYGERTGVITEKTPLNPITPYSLTKMAAESLIKTKSIETNLQYIIFRLPTIYGPWQRSDMTYCQLLTQQLSNTDKKVDYDRVTEDILYIDDILDTLIVAGMKKECKNEIFNLATGKINEWYRGKAIIKKDPSLIPNDERMHVSINNGKVVKELGFKVSTTLEEGIKKQRDHIAKYRNLF